MRSVAELHLEYLARDAVENVAAAVGPDDDGFVTTRIEGTVLRIRAAADSPLSLARALEDVLACVGVAERSLGITRRPASANGESGADEVLGLR